MVLGADKPNYLPQISYFLKMMLADKFVIADDIQFTAHNFINRGLVKSASGKSWLTVPVLTSGKGHQLIKDVKIDTHKNWRQKHWKSLCRNYQYAPYFEYYEEFFETLFRKEWRFLIDVNIAVIEFLNKTLGMNRPLIFSSELNINSSGTSQIIDICRAANCTEYIAWKRDDSFLQNHLFEAAKIALRYCNFSAPEYPQQFENFTRNLSIIDLLFNLGPASKNVLIKSLNIKK